MFDFQRLALRAKEAAERLLQAIEEAGHTPQADEKHQRALLTKLVQLNTYVRRLAKWHAKVTATRSDWRRRVAEGQRQLEHSDDDIPY